MKQKDPKLVGLAGKIISSAREFYTQQFTSGGEVECWTLGNKLDREVDIEVVNM